MKKFNFNLQKVLDVREFEEKKKLEDHAKACEKQEKEKELLSVLQAEERANMQMVSEIKSQHANVGLVNILTTSLEWQHQKVNNQAEKLAEAIAVVKTTNEELIQANIKKRLLQKFKDIKHEQYSDNVRKKEQKFFDEIANIRAYRSNK